MRFSSRLHLRCVTFMTQRNATSRSAPLASAQPTAPGDAGPGLLGQRPVREDKVWSAGTGQPPPPAALARPPELLRAFLPANNRLGAGGVCVQSVARF